jgi:hypothetical protein
VLGGVSERFGSDVIGRGLSSSSRAIMLEMEGFSRYRLRASFQLVVTWRDHLGGFTLGSVNRWDRNWPSPPRFQPGREAPDNHCRPIHRVRHDPARLHRSRTARPRRVPGRVPRADTLEQLPVGVRHPRGRPPRSRSRDAGSLRPASVRLAPEFVRLPRGNPAGPQAAGMSAGSCGRANLGKPSIFRSSASSESARAAIRRTSGSASLIRSSIWSNSEGVGGSENMRLLVSRRAMKLRTFPSAALTSVISTLPPSFWPSHML